MPPPYRPAATARKGPWFLLRGPRGRSRRWFWGGKLIQQGDSRLSSGGTPENAEFCRGFVEFLAGHCCPFFSRRFPLFSLPTADCHCLLLTATAPPYPQPWYHALSRGPWGDLDTIVVSSTYPAGLTRIFSCYNLQILCSLRFWRMPIALFLYTLEITWNTLLPGTLQWAKNCYE